MNKAFSFNFLFLASMRLPSPSETAAQAGASGASSPSRWDNSKADAYGAATANGKASQRPPISLRRGASTIAANESSSHLQGEDPHGAEAYPLPGIDEEAGNYEIMKLYNYIILQF